MGEARRAEVRLAPAGAAVVAVAALSALLIAPAPSYDPWAWLLWGRELAGGTLSTAEGPAFKPLPAAVCALLAPLGAAAPVAWVVVARTGAVLAVALAYRLAGALAALAVALCGGFLAYAATGAETGWTIALILLGVCAWRADRPRAAFACGVACALLRVEAWPFLLAFGVLLWRRRPQDRGLLLTAAVAVPALWLVPEWLASGDPLRSGARALVPNPGQPALASVPALASLREALALPLWPLWAGVVAAAAAVPAARPALLAGLAWIALVAVMAQAGFSGESRYALPGAALVAIAGALGLSALARGRPAVVVVVAVAVVAAAVPKVADLPDLRRAQGWSQGLTDDLGPAIAAAGGRGAVLACGPPYVGDLRGPLLAWHLDVEKRMVRFDPVAPGTVFRSRLRSADAPEPNPPRAFRHVATTGRWEVRAAC